ncbi:oligosaccharyl transferase, archaeosortase A system-associated [Methanofollis sp. UBA420]|uniref:oligosaccharyl transferase, archaeosortase A system-associated n=1 Tax=Methanofollis sp. UBA420 TaxID=1915514 RepID=UPI00316ADE81
MLPTSLTKKQTYLVLGLIVLFSLCALWIRLIPMAGLTAGGEVDLQGIDPWYNMRQVEALAANGLAYQWFDPMTLYPTGDVVHWGPLFPTIIAALTILVGATTRPEIMFVGAIVPPLMGAAMVPLVYLLGRRLSDWKTGLLAAGFTAVVSGHFLYRSLFGFVDHHIAEVLFSTLFVLAYIVAIQAVRGGKVDLYSLESLKKPAILGILAGIAYLLGLFVMPTMILLAMIVAVYTLFQYLIDTWEKKETWNLAVINTVVFAVAIIGLFLFGFPHEGLGLARYTPGHVLAYLAIIVGSWFLYALARVSRDKPAYIYPVLLATIGMVVAILLKVAAPVLYEVLIGNFFGFFGQPVEILTVEEAMPWSIEAAWYTFNVGLLLMAGGFAVLLYGIFQKRRVDYLFVLVWSAIILLSTWQHNRYEYYLSVNIALLAGLFAGFVLERGWQEVAAHRVSEVAAPLDKKTGKNRKEEKKPSGGSDPVVLLGSVIVVILSVFFVISSLQVGLAMAEGSAYGGMHPQWRETLEWMENNTPDTGVDYYKSYEKDSFQYPAESYGVMTWWDYGHFITFLAKRIPNCNPFQHGVAGPNGSAAFFMAQNEDTAAEILTHDGTRYVITDTMMDTGKFWAMATWFDPKAGPQPYQQTWLVPADQDTLVQHRIYTPAYFQTMTSRLHNFDGSMSASDQVYYTEYADAAAAGYGLPVMTNLSILDADTAQAKVEAYNAKAQAGMHAGTIGLENNLTIAGSEAPALQHFRLVHESSQNSYSSKTPDIRYVKVFEFVPGAHIKGEGTIEVSLTANTGRTFTYRQESINGEFVVPYSTSGTPYDVRAAGPYRIVGTGQTFDVSEDAVMQRLTIN